MTLFKMWENAYINKALPPEWPIWEDFRTWAINNRYKAEYGYKGEFSPQGCRKSIPGYKEEPVDTKPSEGEKESAAVEPEISGADKTTINITKGEKPPQKGGKKSAGKKTNTRSGN